MVLTLLHNFGLDKIQHNFIDAQIGIEGYSAFARLLKYSFNMSDIIVEISRYPIRLGQFLKFASIAQDGFEAKALILEGDIAVNGEIELRRGRQLNRGDIIIFENSRYLCR